MRDALGLVARMSAVPDAATQPTVPLQASAATELQGPPGTVDVM
jgi:hypothetical protein